MVGIIIFTSVFVILPVYAIYTFWYVPIIEENENKIQKLEDWCKSRGYSDLKLVNEFLGKSHAWCVDVINDTIIERGVCTVNSFEIIGWCSYENVDD